MSTLIQDGKGRGVLAQVTANNRLAVDSVAIRGEEDAIRSGQGWQIASGPVSFTSATASAILYVKNTGELDLVLDRAVLVLGTPTGGVGDWTFQTLRNPTAGTIVDNALEAGISNSNHGSGNVPQATYYKGVQGDTLTDGSGAPLPIQQASNRTVFPLGRRLPTGSSIGWKLTPPSGTTAATGVLVTHFYYDLSRI
jgi:hypothetical protein